MKRQHTILSALLLTFPAGAWAQTPDQEAESSSEAGGTSAEPAKTTAVEIEEGSSAEDASAAASSDKSEEPGPDEEEAAPTEVESADAQPAAGESSEPENIKLPPNPDAIPAIRGAKKRSQKGSIGLEPGAPQAGALAGGVTPAFGASSANSSDWVFDIHGFLQLPLRVGLNQRENAQAGQKVSVLHTPPVIPGSFQTFEYTTVTPNPWAQLNFSYGNSDVTATVIIAARTVSNANGYFNPADQLGINDAFITFHPESKGKAEYNVHVGAFANRYGIMGEHDLGRYGTPIIGRVSGIGATGTGKYEFEQMDLTLEAGVMGPLNKAPVGVEPAGWNGFADPNAGTTFAVHGHASAGFGESVTVGLHAIHAFAQDDRATTSTQKDGAIDVFGGDARLSFQQFGHLYVGYGYTSADTARSVSGVVRVLNAPGGLGLMAEYFGLESEGTGKLNTFGAQYDLSLGNLLRHPKPFKGNAPDLVVSGFALGTTVESPVPEVDGVLKAKYGVETSYSFLRWMAAGVRYDRVMPDTSDATQTHAIVSPRLIFKSDWSSQDQVVLQYSRYFYGSNTAVVEGYPPQKTTTVDPDKDVISLTASMWW